VLLTPLYHQLSQSILDHLSHQIKVMAAETNVASHCEYFLKVLPVSNMSTNITGIKSLLVEYSELSAELKNKLEFPLHVIEDPEVKNRKFIACELNRVGASYRSPWR
jgi:hypothetical protein